MRAIFVPWAGGAVTEENWPAVMEHYATQMGYDLGPGFRFEGPLFKPEHNYLGIECPLGTICWYVTLEIQGHRTWWRGERPVDAVRGAHQCIVDFHSKLESV